MRKKFLSFCNIGHQSNKTAECQVIFGNYFDRMWSVVVLADFSNLCQLMGFCISKSDIQSVREN